MRVVHISATSSGGAGRAAWRLHEAMIEEGIESFFYSNDITEKKNDNGQNAFQLYNPLPSSFNQRLSYKWRRSWVYKTSERKKKEIYQLFDRDFKKWQCEYAGLPFGHQNLRLIPHLRTADVVILHWVNGTIDLERFFFDFNNTAVIWTLHDMNPFQGLFHYKDDEMRNRTSKHLDDKVREIKRNAYRRKKDRMRIVAPSLWLAEESSKSTLLGSYKTSCIPYSLNLQQFQLKDRIAIRNRMNLLPEEKVILFISDNLENPRKGFDILLAALKIINQSNTKLLALGSRKNEMNEGSQIQYAGKINNDSLMADYFNAADVFILPSREDNLPNVMMEAMACGCAVIGFNVGGVKDHVIDGRTGILAKELSAHCLAETIEMFFKHQEKFDRENIRAYAEEKFNRKLQVAAYKNLISSF